MTGRPNRPLFELLRDSARGALPRPTAPLKIDAPMAARMDRADPVDTHSSRPTPQSRHYIPVSQNAIYIGIAVVLVLLVVAYAAGFMVAQRQAASDYRQRLAAQNTPPLVNEPAGDSRPASGTPRRTDNPSTSDSGSHTASRPASPGPGMQTASDGRYLSSRGNLASDPRQPGLNYLSLAILDQDDTLAAIKFLAENGVETVGVPLIGGQVDRKKPAANNLPAFKLVALQGISGAEYSQRQPGRTQLEDAVERLGATWQKERHGASNFAKHAWEKYQP